jgi:hypothetical protein
VGQVVKFRPSDRVPPSAATQLSPATQLSASDTQQQAMQPRQRQLARRARLAERQQPLRRLIIWPPAARARTSSQASHHAALVIGSVNRWHAYRSYEPAAAVPGCGR